MIRARWTAEAVAEFIAWHEALLVANRYGADVVKELRRARGRFLAGVAP